MQLAEVMQTAVGWSLRERERAYAMELAEAAEREEALAYVGHLIRRYAITPGELAGFFEQTNRQHAMTEAAARDWMPGPDRSAAATVQP